MSKKKQYDEFDEYKEYAPDLTKEEREYIKQFYNEYYHSVKYDEPILTDKQHIKDAKRINNSLYRDAFQVTRKTGKLTYTDDEKLVLELAADEADFEYAFSVGGYELGVNYLMDQTIRDLGTSQDKKVVLSRFYIRMEKLRKMDLKEKRKLK